MAMVGPPEGGTGVPEFFADEGGVRARERMFNEVRARAGHELFTANSLLDLIVELERGAGNMVAAHELSPTDLDRSAKATGDFLDRMQRERASLGMTSFTEETVSRSRWSLCPGFWPFC